jgi:hypothetical protein
MQIAAGATEKPRFSALVDNYFVTTSINMAEADQVIELFFIENITFVT